jgi:hypothetical protein
MNELWTKYEEKKKQLSTHIITILIYLCENNYEINYVELIFSIKFEKEIQFEIDCNSRYKYLLCKQTSPSCISDYFKRKDGMANEFTGEGG